ncbi:hypothetical protein [Candidatus Methanomassiliicoccus intestinalis]|uniref:hypothetical protein n=1 Tax=Candidatus Methanomassiliicoccus intestinalis TaxID=1406512 RepID=UPI0037DC3144
MTNSHRGGGLTVLEAAAVHGSNLYVGMMVFALAIFVFAIKHQEKKAPSFLVYLGRELSGGIYIIHPAIILMFNLSSVSSWANWQYLEPLAVYLISAAIVFTAVTGMKLINSLQNRKRNVVGT